MKTMWQTGLALAVLAGMTAAATAQPNPRDFFKKAIEAKKSKDGSGSEIDKAKAEIKSLESQIEKLKAQVDDASKKLAKAGTPGKGFEGKKFGPPEGKGWGEKKDFKGPQTARAGDKKGPPDWKGGPPWAREGEKKFGPPDWKGGRGPSANPWGRPDVQAKGPPSRYDSRSSSRGPSSDLESRVNRLERAVDELRREIRYRR